jgi:hypothetical protein
MLDLSQCNVIKVLVVVDGVAERVVVTLIDVDVVEGLVDGDIVVLLDVLEVCLDEGKLVGLFEECDGAGVVDARHEDNEQVVEQKRLVLQVELDRLVEELCVRNLPP